MRERNPYLGELIEELRKVTGHGEAQKQTVAGCVGVLDCQMYCRLCGPREVNHGFH